MTNPNIKSWSASLRRSLLPTAALFLLSVGTPGRALALDVIGNINANTTWKKSDSPVRMTGDVTVAGHVTLTIEPGTVIEAAATDGLGSGTDTARVELIIKGALKSNGTATDRIVIRGASRTSGLWYGISVEPGAKDSSLSFTDISDASYGIYSRTTSAFVLSDFSLSNCDTGFYWQTSPGPTVTRASISGAAGNGMQIADDGTAGAMATLTQLDIRNCGLSGLRLSPRVNATVTRSNFSRNGKGIETDSGSALLLTNSVIVANKSIGAQLAQAGSSMFRIINNTFDHNNQVPESSTAPGVGLQVNAVSDASKFIVRNNNITGHGTLGVNVMGGVSPSLDHNNVWGNATNYSMGISAGSGAISANPLYRSASGKSGATFDHHGYPNNDSWTFSCSDPGAAQVYIILSDFASESGYDVLTLTDGAGATVQTFTGSLGSNIVSSRANGNTMNLRFTSDGSGTLAGFGGTCYYAYGTPNYRLQGGSPAIDVGNNLDAPTSDFDALLRPQDGDMDGTATTDIGAFEWHANKSPIARPGADLIVLANKDINFDGRPSMDPDGMIVGYSWDLGDGSPAETTPQVTHKYTMLGTYTVKLTVTDDEGSMSSDSLKVTVTDNLPPIANAGADQKVSPGSTVNFDGGGSSDPDGTIVSYAWSFGDATPNGSGRTVTHIYATAGTYKATLTVTDNKGATGSAIATITVGDGGMMMPDGGTMMMPDGGTGFDMAQGGPENMNKDPQRPTGEVTGCGCRIGGTSNTAEGALIALLCGLGLLMLTRRRWLGLHR